MANFPAIKDILSYHTGTIRNWLEKISIFISNAEKFRIRLLQLGAEVDRISLVMDMELDYVGIGSRIAKRRAQMGLKQITLAEKIGISNNYLSSIERGKEKLGLEILVSICRELRVTPDYLLMGNLYANNVSQNIVDGLRLCSEADLELLNVMLRHMIQRQGTKWNNDNFA